MPKNFKRSIRGYDAESIQQEINTINQMYDNKIQELKKEIFAQTHQRQLLRNEYNKLKQEFGDRVELQEQIKDKLYEKYLEILEQQLITKRKTDHSIAELENQVKLRQEELSKYKGYSNKVKSDILRVRDSFKSILEEGDEI
ncbi:MAG: hypothetical protein APF84_10650 [Gracilibacter sp. BRH_c7a]|nr:MAG: hypothetical protein APF84_10650 [Gracilibacter sp. BRH_c7a]